MGKLFNNVRTIEDTTSEMKNVLLSLDQDLGSLYSMVIGSRNILEDNGELDEDEHTELIKKTYAMEKLISELRERI